MKRIKKLSTLLVLIATFGFIACDTEPVDPVFLDYEPEEELPASFEVTIDGELFTATATQAVIADGIIVIQGVRGTNGEAVSIAVEGTSVGVYTEALLSYSPNDDSDFSYLNIDPEFNSTGSVTIASIDTANNTISGTFNFTGYWSDTDAGIDEPVVLTNGTFVNLPYTGSLIDPADEEYFSATVGGEDIDYSIILSAEAGNTVTLSGQIVSPATQIQLLMPITITPGTYTIQDSTNIYAIYAEGTDPYTGAVGELTIISNSDGWIEGEFEFTAYDMDDNPIQITNGEFNVELP